MESSISSQQSSQAQQQLGAQTNPTTTQGPAMSKQGGIRSMSNSMIKQQ